MADGKITVEVSTQAAQAELERLRAGIEAALLNVSPLLARCESGSKAHQILRQALSDYADAYMDQPATKDEVRAISRLHARRN